jgi:hypothetical protein
MKKFTSHKSVIFFLALTALFFTFCIVFYYGGLEYAGDGVRHYLVSRWCWKHPDLLLYLWGKPLFTLISSPFSHLGHKGIQAFNLIISLSGTYSLYKICIYYRIQNAAFIVFIVFFSPVYFSVVNTGLTEPLFFAMISWSAHLLIKEKYLLSCVLISFLPFVRAEGNLIVILFLLVLIIRKKYKFIPSLITGTFIYSLIGGFYYKDFLWVFTMNAYNGSNKDFYGQGELLSFVKAYNRILGIPLTILFLSGLLYYFKIFFSKRILLFLRSYDVEILILTGSFAIYLIAHSIFWWKGLYNSLGLIRPIAGVVPLASLACLRGLNVLESMIPDKKNIRNIFCGIFLFTVIYFPFLKHYFPLQLNEEDKVTEQALKWFKNSPYRNKIVFYLNPYLVEKLDRDPFDPSEVRELWALLPGIKEWGYKSVPDSTVIFWDAHFGPNEARVKLDTLYDDRHLILLKVFKPETSFRTLGGYDYTIHLFARIPQKVPGLSSSMFFDLENDEGLENIHTIEEGEAHSGKRFSALNNKNEFSALYPIPIKKINMLGTVNKVAYTFFIKSESKINNAKIVFSISDGDKTLQWTGKDLKSDAMQNGQWQKEEISFDIYPSKYSESNAILKIYVWNKGREIFSMDDININLLK